MRSNDERSMKVEDAVATLTGPLALALPEERVETGRKVAAAAAVLLDVIGAACFGVAEALDAGLLAGTSGDPTPRCRELWRVGLRRLLEVAEWPELQAAP